MVLSRPYLTCSEGKRRGIEWEGMFEVFGVDDVSVLSFNECLLAGSRRGEGEYAVVTCDDNEELVRKEKETPRVAVTMRYDTQNKYQIEGSHVRGCLVVIMWFSLVTNLLFVQILLHQWVLDLFGLSSGQKINIFPLSNSGME